MLKDATERTQTEEQRKAASGLNLPEVLLAPGAAWLHLLFELNVDHLAQCVHSTKKQLQPQTKGTCEDPGLQLGC